MPDWAFVRRIEASVRVMIVSFAACFFLSLSLSLALQAFARLYDWNAKNPAGWRKKKLSYVFFVVTSTFMQPDPGAQFPLVKNMCALLALFSFLPWVVSSQSNVCCIVAALLNFRDDKILEHNIFMCCTIHVYCIWLMWLLPFSTGFQAICLYNACRAIIRCGFLPSYMHHDWKIYFGDLARLPIKSKPETEAKKNQNSFRLR